MWKTVLAVAGMVIVLVVALVLAGQDNRQTGVNDLTRSTSTSQGN